MDLTFGQFDSLFQFHTALLAPWSSESRYHSLVERLDLFPEDSNGSRKMFVSTEATKDENGDEGTAAVNASILMRSEGVRRRFIQQLVERRELEDVVSRQRILRVDQLGQKTKHTRIETESIEPRKSARRISDIRGLAIREKEGKIRGDSSEEKVKRTIESTRREENVSEEKSFIDEPSSGDTDLSQKFELGEQVVRSKINEFSRIIIESRAAVLAERGSIKRIIDESKKRLWTEMQTDSKLRAQWTTDRQSKWEDLEMKRSQCIAEKTRINALKYSVAFADMKADINLNKKHFFFRVQKAKARIVENNRKRLEVKNQKIRDCNKLCMLRNRNIEIKLEVRDRRLKEIKWKRERLITAGSVETDPISSCHASVVDSHTSRSHVILEDEKEKTLFLESLNRHERVLQKLTLKACSYERPRKTPTQIEVDRYNDWKNQVQLKREHFTTLKQNREEEKRLSNQRLRDKSRSSLEQCTLLESMRRKMWNELDENRNKLVVNAALKRVSFIDELIPTLSLS